MGSIFQQWVLMTHVFLMVVRVFVRFLSSRIYENIRYATWRRTKIELNGLLETSDGSKCSPGSQLKSGRAKSRSVDALTSYDHFSVATQVFPNKNCDFRHFSTSLRMKIAKIRMFSAQNSPTGAELSALSSSRAELKILDVLRSYADFSEATQKKNYGNFLRIQSKTSKIEFSTGKWPLVEKLSERGIS